MGNLRLSLVISVLACGWLTACNPVIPCKPGLTRICLCPNQIPSGQVCQGNARWGACQCGDTTMGDGGGAHDGSTVQPGSDGGNVSVKDAGHSAKDSGMSSHDDGGVVPNSDAATHSDGGSHLAAGTYAGACSSNACASNETCQKQMSGLPATTFSYCAATCTTATDCPTPSSGAATKSCNAVTHVCELMCSALAACPTGMMCPTAALLAPQICAWPG